MLGRIRERYVWLAFPDPLTILPLHGEKQNETGTAPLLFASHACPADPVRSEALEGLDVLGAANNPPKNDNVGALKGQAPAWRGLARRAPMQPSKTKSLVATYKRLPAARNGELRL